MKSWKQNSKNWERTLSAARLSTGLVLAFLFMAGGAAPAAAGFRVTPYVQNPHETGVTLMWFSDTEQAGEVRLYRAGEQAPVAYRSAPLFAPEMAYQESEQPKNGTALPYRHELRLHGLVPGGQYRYTVEQGGETVSGEFRTRPEEPGSFRFIVFADSETEPESVGSPARWPGTGPATAERRYLVDQERGYRENLRVIAERSPDFVAIAGDLVESGGEQRDWDEFWRLTAPLASGTPIYPALGNHEYWAGPNASRRFQEWEAERAVAKYRSYFDLPSNGMGPHHERYYSIDWGPLTLVVLDLNNGVPHRSAADTNWYQRAEGEGGFAPSWAPGSLQYRWLEKTLQRAQRESAFTFVMFHYSPYSSGPHALPAGDGEDEDPLSGVPLRALSPLFQRHGVDVVLNGHDEMAEHSILPGEHEIHFYDVGIGGDGLRGPAAGAENPYRVFLAHDDAPEVYDENGILVDGGKHYGHLEVNVSPDAAGGWRARFDMVHVFPVMDADGRVVRFERRLYDDSLTLVSRDKIE
ncbi:MAG: metallophosphoesterase [Xanthomonadales bacterium]|jgi:hypothetical protein|nr:metallophosphoesterase [Xanthomonadales bacterium]